MIPVPAPNQTIAPNGRIDFLVKFTPPDKNPHNDVILIESSDPDEPEIEVILEGSNTKEYECELIASPTSVNFQLVPVGRSKKLSVVVTNDGWGECKVTAVNVLGRILRTTRPSNWQAPSKHL